ncbi:glycosyltransferase family 4 protein [Arenibacter algicola]|uniref:N-acetyl-alpha-D-glucosaminyl L-malate synthase n=1 Tax=Arenibacter algicola TaxID=616991 RepID=A0A221V344_9FLAO|nr:glycosyltransferase family 4 protein [Arenibacter algicola]ASO07970.1 N-acetyl-alpha-D-glucosaminyl L-malate synthase [Arenibacter algicola]
MKVLHVFDEINFSGAELMYSDAASYIQKKGIKLFALSTGVKFGNFISNFEAKDIDIIHKTYKGKFVLSYSGISFYWFLFKFLKKNKIEVLHIHRDDIYFASIIGFLLNVRCVKTQHSIFHNRRITRPIAIMRRAIVRLFFNVNFHSIGESVYMNELNYYKNPTTKINNWYNPERFYEFTESEKTEIRKQLNIPNNTFVIISVGGCAHIKNHHDALKSTAILKEKLNILYLHLGKGKTECEEKQLAKSLDIEKIVRFVGNKENVRDYLIASDVFVMPSKFEGLGNSCLEAMACRVPTVLYNVVGLKDLITNNDNGFLVESNPKDLADKIILYADNPQLRMEKSTNALAFVIKNHGMYSNVDLMLALYRKGGNLKEYV